MFWIDRQSEESLVIESETFNIVFVLFLIHLSRFIWH